MFQKIIFVLLLTLSVQAQNKFDLLKQLFYENESGKHNPELLQELKASLLLTTDVVQQAELRWMLAQVQLQSSDSVSAILNLSELLYLHPKSEFSGSALDLLGSVKFNYQLPPFFYTDSLKIPHYLDVQERTFAFVSDFYSLNLRQYDLKLIDVIAVFLTQYPNSNYKQVLFLWQAQLYLNTNQSHFAESLYRYLIQSELQSSEQAQALLALARISVNKLNDPERAEQYYLELIGAFPDPEYGGTGQYELGLLYADKLKDFESAESQLKLYQIHYSGHPSYAAALKQLAQINEIQEDWTESCNYYQLFYELAPQDTFAIEALNKIEIFALNKLKDYKRAALVLLIEARVLGDANKMFLAAQINIEQLRNLEQGKNILIRLIEEYPNNEAAQKAQKQLEKMN